jgi:WD40 repeat protein
MQRDPKQKANKGALIEGMVIGGLTVIGLTGGTGPLAGLVSIAAPIAGDWTSALVQRAFDHWSSNWFTERGALNDPITALLRRAFTEATRQLRHDWPHHEHYQLLRGTNPKEAARTLEVLGQLQKDAAYFLKAKDRLTAALRPLDAKDILRGTEDNRREILRKELNQYFSGEDEVLVGFVHERLVDEWLLRFSERLTDDPSPEGRRAWRAWQRLWQDSLVAALAHLQQTTDQTLVITRWLQDWAQRLERMPDTRRDNTGEKELKAALAPVQRRLDELKVLAEKTLQNTEVLKTGVDQIGVEIQGIGAGIQNVETNLGALRNEVINRPLLSIGPDAVITQIFENQAHNVSGLMNPYLGLRSFTYAERSIYAGREQLINAAVDLLSTPGTQRTLLFVTGASGSGKSSFAQAGLLPALEAYYDRRRLRVARAIFHPSRRPLDMLADALVQLGVPPARLQADADTATSTPAAFHVLLQEHTPREQVNLLVIDQFEELFTQSEPEHRRAVFAILGGLAPFSTLRTHIIVTMRSDYLPELFEVQDLYDCAKHGVDLRAMSVMEMKAAIQRPVQVFYQAREKRWEPALVEKLSQDAAVDATYLPLLQVTLEEIWEGGWLTLDRYSTLTDAIKMRAEAIYTYADHAGQRQVLRTPEEQALMLDIFLDLVDVSLDDARRDIRRRRPVPELIAGSQERARLVEELLTARLLSVSQETQADQTRDMLDIIHETLIGNWDRLQAAIDKERQALQQRVRFEQAVREWRANNYSDQYLLVGVRLAEARALETRGDVALRWEEARNLLDRSVAQQEAEQRRKREEQEQVARQSQLAVRRRVFLQVGAFLVLLLAIGAGLSAAQANEAALRQARKANAQALAANARVQLDSDPEFSVLLAMEAISVSRRYNEEILPQAEDVLHLSLSRLQVPTTLQVDTYEIWDAAWSPDGRSILTSSDDGSVTIWNASSGQRRATLRGHGNSVHSVAWSPDSKYIVTGRDYATASTWDASSGRELMILSGHDRPLNSVAWSPDGKWIVTASVDQTAKVWDPVTGHVHVTLQGHSSDVNSAAWSPDSKYIVTGSDDGTARTWDAGTGLQITTFGTSTPYSPFVLDVAWSLDGKQIATAYGDTTAKIWDVSTAQKEVFLIGHNAGVNSVAWSPDGQQIVTASADGTAKTWNASTGQESITFRGHIGWVNSAAWSADGQKIITTGSDGTARVWTTTANQERATLTGHSSVVNEIAWSADGQQIITASWDGTASIWDAWTGQKLASLIGHTAEVNSAAWSPDGKHIVTASADSTARIWDTTNLQIHAILSGHSSWVNSAAWSPDGKFIVTASFDGTAKIWDSDTGREISTLLAHTDRLMRAVWSPNGKCIVTTSTDGTAKVWETETWQVRMSFHGHRGIVSSAAFSPDSNNVVTGSFDGTAQVWDVNTGQERTRLEGHIGNVYDVAWSPDGKSIVTASADGTTKLWDATSGQNRATLYGHVDAVRSVAWSPDSKTIATGGFDGTARQYVIEIEDLLVLASSRVTRGLTPKERTTYLGEPLPGPTQVPLVTPEP